MRLQKYINEGVFNKTLTQIKKLDPRRAKEVLKSAWRDLKRTLEEHDKEDEFLQIINAQMGTTFRTLSQIDKTKLQEGQLNEDFAHLWGFFKEQLFPATSIFPALQIWFEIDKLLEGAGITDLNFKKMAIYGTLWVLLVTVKHIGLWKHWKKEKPEEYEKEGKPGPFSFRRKK